MTRIIAGRCSGAQLRTPAGDKTRPTTDKVREAAFNTLATWFSSAARSAGEQLAGYSFLDLFSGSGAVGLEAASRGAQAVLVEKDRAVAKVIKDNAARTKLVVKVVTADAGAFLESPPKPFDVAWLDPPYALDNKRLANLLNQLQSGWLADDGLVIVERSAKGEAFAWPNGYSDSWQRRYGDSVLSFARWKARSFDE